MTSRVISVVFAPALVDDVCDAVARLGAATSGDIARNSDRSHDDTAGVLAGLADAGYVRLADTDGPHGVAGGLWSFTQAGRSKFVDELVEARKRVAELEAVIAAPVKIAPAASVPFEWPSPAAKWPWPPPDPAPLTYSVNLVLGGAKHRLAVTPDDDGGFAASIDGTVVLLIQNAPSDPPPPLPLWRRVVAAARSRSRTRRIFIG